MLATVNLKMGNKEEAKKWFEKLLTFDAVKEEDKEVIFQNFSIYFAFSFSIDTI